MVHSSYGVNCAATIRHTDDSSEAFDYHIGHCCTVFASNFAVDMVRNSSSAVDILDWSKFGKITRKKNLR